MSPLGFPWPVWMLLVLAFGMMVGSFLNVLVHRLPRGQSIVHPPSHCPRCGHGIRWFENLPVLSWLRLGGRCGECGGEVAMRYPLVELGTGLLFVLVAAFVTAPLALAAWWFFVAALWALVWIDLEHFLLPNALTYPLALVGAAFAALVLGRPLGLLTVDVLLGPAFLGAVRWLYFRWRGIEGLGLGDVKLMAGVGAFLGWQGVIGTLFLGSLAGAIVGGGAVALGGGGMRTRMPFGPFLVAGALCWMVLGMAGLSHWILPPLKWP